MTRATTIVCVELGMLSCVAVAFFLLAGSTPLATFLSVSARCFVAGNILLVAKLQKSNPQSPREKTWSHIWNAFAILAIGGLISSFFLGMKH